MTPIDTLLEQVEWQATDAPPSEGLYATHSGVFEFAGHSLRCYRLNNGEAVFDADDLGQFFAEMNVQMKSAP